VVYPPGHPFGPPVQWVMEQQRLAYEMARRAAEERSWTTFCLQAPDATETADFYKLAVERHQKTSTLVTSNRSPDEWLALMADPLLAQSAVDQLTSTAHELIVEGDSYRRRQRPNTSPPR
jgi:hypothetical protein